MAVLLMASLSTFAQEKKEKPEGGRGRNTEKVTPDEQTKQLAKELDLNDKQQAKVKALYTEQEKDRAAFKPEEGKKGEKPAKGEKAEKPNHDEMEAKMKKDNEAFDAKMKGILTAEQYTKWQASQKKGRGSDKPERGGAKKQLTKKES